MTPINKQLTIGMDIREFFFNYRGYTPIPLFLAFIFFAQPTPLGLVAGAFVALAGEGLRLWGVHHAGGATRTTSGVGGDELIMRGPFAYVRNPLYLGNFLVLCGLCLMAWAWMPWMVIAVMGLFALQYGLIIALEEEHLRKKFGEKYERYVANVPRFLPRLTPFRPDSAPPSSRAARAQQRKPWARTLRIERSTLLMLLLMTSAILLRWKP